MRNQQPESKEQRAEETVSKMNVEEIVPPHECKACNGTGCSECVENWHDIMSEYHDDGPDGAYYVPDEPERDK
jgi:hypothetical protein